MRFRYLSPQGAVNPLASMHICAHLSAPSQLVHAYSNDELICMLRLNIGPLAHDGNFLETYNKPIERSDAQPLGNLKNNCFKKRI